MGRIAFFAVASAALLGTSSVALASAGCTALNGSYAGGVPSGSATGTGFNAGDVITLTVTAVGGADRLGLYNNTSHNPLVPSFTAIGTQSYTVPATTTDEFLISGTQSNAASNFSWSCAAGSSASGDVQTKGTAAVANISASTVTAAVSNVIDEGLGAKSQPETLQFLTRDEFVIAFFEAHYADGNYPQKDVVAALQVIRQEYDRAVAGGRGAVKTAKGLRFVKRPITPNAANSYFPQTKSETERYVDDVFASLSANSLKVRATLAPQWTAWGDVRLSGFQAANPNTLSGLQINALAGLSYKALPGVVVGAFAGYEAFNYEFAAITGSLRGGGATLGTYSGIDVTPTLRWKGMLAWTGLGYGTNDGAATGNFTGSRLMLSTGLSGKIDMGDYVVEPSADILALWEHQSAYTDSLGAVHGDRDVSNGRIALGAKVTAEQWSDVFTPYLGIYGDWRFASADAGLGDSWSARVTSGVSMPVSTNGSLSLGGEYGGIGASYKTWSANAQLKVQF